MKRIVLPMVAALLALPACGAGEEAGPGSTAPEPRPAPLPDQARVVCEPTGARLETPSVRPQRDGVHFEIVNETGAERVFAVKDSRGGGMGQGAPVGRSTLVTDLGPGSLEVSCSDPASEQEAGVALEVIDEGGVYVAAPLDCETVTSGVLDYVAGAKGEPTPEDAVRTNEGDRIEPGDVLAPVGYPEAESQVLGVTRDGTTIATFTVVSDGSGGWLLESTSFCPPYGGG